MVGFISSRAAGTMSAIFVGVGSFVGVLKYFIYYVNCCFLGDLPLAAGS